ICGDFKAAEIGTSETDAEVGRSGLEGKRDLLARMKTDPGAGDRSTKCPLCVHQLWKPSAGVPAIKQARCPRAAILVTPPKLLRRVNLTWGLCVQAIEGPDFCGHSPTIALAQVVASVTQQDREKLQTLSRSITGVRPRHGSSPGSDPVHAAPSSG